VGNRIAAFALLAVVLLLGAAVKLLPGKPERKAAPRAAPLVLFVENEGPQYRRPFLDFERKLRARLGNAAAPRLEFVPIAGGDGEPARERFRKALARGPVAVVAMSGGGAAEPIRDLDPTMPMVFFTNADPIVTGLVKDLNHPGVSRTGITVAIDTSPKRLAILSEAVPTARRIGILVDPGTPLIEFAESISRMKERGVSVVLREAKSSPEGVRAAIADPGIDAWYVPYNGASAFNQDALMEALAQARRPAMFERAKFADAGGLLAYQHVVEDGMGRMAEMLASILQGVDPGDIPVVRPQRYELVVNLQTARRLGITLPKGLVKRADRVIDGR
jgi:putative ABC transport system substrate-binding protein